MAVDEHKLRFAYGIPSYHPLCLVEPAWWLGSTAADYRTGGVRQRIPVACNEDHQVVYRFGTFERVVLDLLDPTTGTEESDGIGDAVDDDRPSDLADWTDVNAFVNPAWIVVVAGA